MSETEELVIHHLNMLANKVPEEKFIEALESVGYVVTKLNPEEFERRKLDRQLLDVKNKISALQEKELEIITKQQELCVHDWEQLSCSNDHDGWTKGNYSIVTVFQCSKCGMQDKKVSIGRAY